MNKPSKCKNCQWYCKPYWSIINPCDSCPIENNVEIITIGDVKPIQEYLTEEEIKKAITDKSIFELTIEEKDKEIERLNKELKEIKQLHKDMFDIALKNEMKIDKLNNIIDELEKYLETEKDNHSNSWHYREWIRQVFNKLKELKEDKDDVKMG